MINQINLQPILAFLKSRKVIISLCALALNLLVAAVPDLAPYRAALMTVITGLALGLIGGMTYADAAHAGSDAGSLPPISNADLIKLLLGDMIDSISTDLNGQTVITLKK